MTAFKLMWEYGMLGDLLPELASFIAKNGGDRCVLWKHLESLDAYERMMAGKGFEVSNAVRAAVLMSGMYQAQGREGAGRKVMQTMMDSLKIPKAVYFSAVLLLESGKRLSSAPAKGKSRFIYNRDFLDALDFNRILARAEKRSEDVLNSWADLYEEKRKENENESIP
jgi:hypothetical protein